MTTSIPQYIRSYTFGSRKAASDLMLMAQKEKRNLGFLSQNLSALSGISPFSDLNVASLRIGSVNNFVDFFRDFNLKVREFYVGMNTIDYTLFTASTILYSEIMSLEKSISDMEKYINNYSFISGEDDLFNGSFVETFSDNVNIYLNDLIKLEPVDRDGQKFLKNEVGIIDTVKGSLKSGSSFVEYITVPKVIDYNNNYSQYISSESEIENLFSEASNKSWTVTVKSPSILRSKIQDINHDLNYNPNFLIGANSCFTVQFEKPKQINCIKISPNFGHDFQLLQVVLYRNMGNSNNSFTGNSSSSSSGKTFLLQGPLFLDSAKDIAFEEQQVSSIKFIFNQPMYKRITATANAQEMHLKTINQFLSSLRKKRMQKHDKLQDVVYSYFLRKNQIVYVNADVGFIPDYYTYRYPCEDTEPQYGALSEFLEGNQSFIEMDSKNRFSNTNKLTIMIESMVSYVLGDKFRMSPSAYISTDVDQQPQSTNDILHDAHYPVGDTQGAFSKSRQDSDNVIAMIDRHQVQSLDYTVDQIGHYEYSFSLKSIKFVLVSNSSTKNTVAPTTGNGINQSKTFFISKKLDTNGYVNKIKMKSDYFIPQVSDISLDMKDACAIEFSVSNRNQPENDSDWLPIIPNRITHCSMRNAFSKCGNWVSQSAFSRKTTNI